MKHKLIKGEKDYSSSDVEYQYFGKILKLYLLGNTIYNKIVDISCFYNMTTDDIVNIVNKTGGM